MQTLNLLIEFVPVILAIIAIPSLVSTINYGRKKSVVFPAIISCVLLIVAQTGWTQALLTHNSIAMTLFDKIWTVFNSLVMITFIIWSKQTRKVRRNDNR